MRLPHILRRLLGLHPERIWSLRFLASHLSIVIGLVLVWRGVWYVLDGIDAWLFGGHHVWTALAGIVLGLLVLYLPDKDLKEISKL